MPNYAFTTQKGLPKIKDNHVFERANFAQATPGTKIFEGKKGLVFKDCNLVNCIVPSDAIVDGCLTIQKEFCGNLHSNWVEKGYISSCPENCSHVVEENEIKIDGKVMDTMYEYKDKVL